MSSDVRTNDKVDRVAAKDSPFNSDVDRHSGPTHSSSDVVRKTTHYFETLTDAMRPQDDGNLKFDVVEHGINSFPETIRVTDSQGRWCVYAPITENGRDVRSHGYFETNVHLEDAKERDNQELRESHSLQHASS